MLKNRLLGSVMLISGTAIGAGMLALPTSTAAAGFLPTICIFLVVWGMTVASALLLLEVNLSLPHARDMLSMAEASLGKPGKIVTWFAFMCLLYALTAAYITGGAQWIDTGLSQLPLQNSSHPVLHFVATWQKEISAVLFTTLLSLIIYLGTHAVDHVNRLFMVLMAVSFIGIESIGLNSHAGQVQTVGDAATLWPAIPVIITSFGFHPVIPSLSEYLNRDRTRLKKAILIGSTIPLIVYIMWIGTVFNWLPADAIQSMVHAGDKLSAFILLTSQYGNTPLLALFLKVFALAVLLTSFLGVAMSLFHFLEDGLHHRVSHPLIVTLITFLPPLFFALKFPQGFIFALGFGGIFVAVLLGILPCLMAWKVRQQNTHTQRLLLGGRPVLILLMLLFTIVIAIEVYYAHLMPYLHR